MRCFIWKTVLVTLLASSWSAADAAILELTPTSQFAVQGSTIYRSVDLPPSFVVEPSPFGQSRPCLGYRRGQDPHRARHAGSGCG